MKHLSSRWTLAALLAPVLLILAILIVGIEPPEASTGGKGNVQIAFTGSVSTTNGFSLGYQSVFLNVIAVRFNPSSDLTVSENDPNWQIVSVPNGTTAGQSVPSLAFGDNFGPNGNAVTLGQGRAEMQIDVASLQNTVQVFNTGSIKAQNYGQIELSLDPNVQGSVVPQCGAGSTTGEGCVSYPLQFPSNVSSVRVAAPTTLVRGETQLVTLAIDVNLGPSPIQGGKATGQFVQVTPSICLIPQGSQTTPSSCAAPNSNPPYPTGLNINVQSGIVSGTVTGATNSIFVNAEQTGTSHVISSIKVNKNTHTYSMTLPVGTYDFYTSGRHRTIDAHQSVAVLAGSNSTLDFNVHSASVESLSGAVIDGCTSAPLPGATLTIYQPANEIDINGVTTDCAASSTAPCTTTCDPTTNGAIPPGCMVIGTASTDLTGSFPLPGSGNVSPQFKQIPVFKSGAYALEASSAGYNSALQPVTTKSGGALQCPASSFKQKGCEFGLLHGEIDVNANLVPSGGSSPTSDLNILVNAEDSGTFNGENVGLVTVPAGSTTNSKAVPIFVPISPTPSPSPALQNGAVIDPAFVAEAKATATITPTPVIIGGPAAFDLYGSVQDLFGTAPEKNTGHTIAVMSGIAAPPVCAAAGGSQVPPTVTLTGFTCVGHGSVPGVITSAPNQNTLLIVSKNDTNGVPVDIMTTNVIGPVGSQNSGNFAICAPADTEPYTITHVETRPSGTPTPTPFGSADVTLTGPIVIGAAPNATPTCQGICSDFSQNTNGKSCLLCQNTQPGVTLP